MMAQRPDRNQSGRKHKKSIKPTVSWGSSTTYNNVVPMLSQNTEKEKNFQIHFIK